MTDHVSKARCSFCNRGVEDGLDCLIHSRYSHSNICEDCATGLFLTYERQKELKKAADKLAEGREEGASWKDDDGTCHCPGCTYQRAMQDDPVLNTIARTMTDYSIPPAEETTGQTRH